LLGGGLHLFFLKVSFDYQRKNMSMDMDKRRGNKTARVTRGSRNPKHGKRKH
jgi:hypothetical protein